MSTKKELRVYINGILKEIGLSSSEADAEARLILSYTENDEDIKQILNRRKKREPIQYILGKANFYDIELTVGPGVLIPRFDTELLVDLALEYINTEQKEYFKILDLCAGSGAIGLSILNNTSNTEIVFADISRDALYYARLNASNLGLTDRSYFVESDMFEKITGLFDLIVCNPPYITEREVVNLEAELFYEPKLALLSEYDKFYKILANELENYLKENGVLIVELNANYATEIYKIFSKSSYTTKIYKDFNKLNRAIVLK